MREYVLYNGIIINEGNEYKASLWIKDGKIHKIILPEEKLPAVEIIDLEGKYVFPGVIDTHVHFREPGLTEQGDIHTESRAAAAGGVTSFFDMPNTKPPALHYDDIVEKIEIAKDNSLINYAFYPAVNKDNIDHLLSIDPGLIPGIKLFTAGSTGGLRLEDDDTLHKLFEQDIFPVVAHAETQEILDKDFAAYRDKFPHRAHTQIHQYVRSELACLNSTMKLVDLARKYNTKLHLLHISTQKELSFLEYSKRDLPNLTVEVCPQYMWFSNRDYPKYGNFIKCNPSIKSEEDRLFIVRAVKDHIVDTIATDHAPHNFDKKLSDYWDAPSGIASIQHAYISLLHLFSCHNIPFTLFAELTAHKPAKIFSVCNRGFIREGYIADLFIVERQKWRVKATDVLHKANWSIFEGFSFDFKVNKTIVNGNIVYDNGKIVYNLPGEPVKFCR